MEKDFDKWNNQKKRLEEVRQKFLFKQVVFPYLQPGNYSITETVPAGWTKTSDACGSITVTLNQTVACAIVNTKNNPASTTTPVDATGLIASFTASLAGSWLIRKLFFV